MKNIAKVLVAAGLLAGATSCSNFLEPDPKGQMVTENFFQSQNDLEMAINALYYNVAYAQTNSNPTIPQVQGDDITSTTGSNKGAYLSADSFEEPSDYKGVEALWLNQYRIIQAANLIVDNADRASASQEYINMAKGNALFWRACAYFQLVRVFGPLPINLHNEADDNKTPLTSVDGVYKLIVEDLETADSYNIPATYKETENSKYKYGYTGSCNYWVTRQAVKSALSAVYMSMAGYPLNLGTEYYKKAADKAKEVIDGVAAGTYALALESDWNQVYSCGNDWSAEQLITISYYDSPGTMGEMAAYTSQFCKCHRFPSLKNGWSDFVPEYRWWANFPDGPRKNAVYDPMLNIYLKDSAGKSLYIDWWALTKSERTAEPGVYDYINGISPRHPMFAPFTINADDEGAPIREPHDYRKPAYDGQSYPQNHRFIRYSEVLCWFAESAARAGVYTAEAQAALQQVIDRAYDSTNKINASSLTGDALAKQAFLEHGYEVTGYPLALVTRRADQFRLGENASGVWADQTLKAAWQYRSGEQTDVLVPAGTVTHGYSITNKGTQERPKWRTEEWVYTLDEDIKLKEDQPVAATWNGIRAMYHPYPPTEVEKNPNLVR